MFTRLLRSAARTLPSQCAVCSGWGHAQVCTACVARFAAPAPRCITCALTVPEGVGQCGACVRQPSALDACHAAVDYAYPWDGLLAKLKFNAGSSLGGVSGANPAVAGAMASIMRQRDTVCQALAQADWAVPIPLAPERLKHRGFNQAVEISKPLLAPSPMHTVRARLRTDILLRTRDTAPQVGMNRAQRQSNMLNAFAVEPRMVAQVSGARVLLIDDVTTTTATLHAAATVLRSAGAAQVVALVFARTPETPSGMSLGRPEYNRGLC
jgi:ComF family protein